MHKIKVVLSALLLVIVFSLSGQNKQLDSLYSVLENHPSEDTIRVDLLTTICYYEYTSQPEKNKAHAEEALKISKKLNYENGSGGAYKYLSLYYLVSGDYELATRYGLEMLKAFESVANYSGIGRSYAVLGAIHHDNNDFEKSLEYGIKALEIHQRINSKLDIGYDYNGLASLYQEAKNYPKALEYHLKALKIREEIKDENGLGQTYNNLGLIYSVEKNYSKAIEYIEKAIPVSEKLNNKYRLSSNYGNLGEIYTITGNYNKAESYLLKALGLAKDLRHKRLLEETYEDLSALEIARGKYERALEYTNAHHQYKDSIYTEEKSKQLLETETRFETEKKDQLISIQKSKQFYLLIGLLALVITSAIIYILQRVNNKKIKKLLEVQKSLNKKLQESDQLRSRFFANISHEFRTPLTLIQTPIEEKLGSSSLLPSEEESFRLIKRNANRLLALVNQLLDLSKLEANSMNLHIQQGDLNKFITTVVASFDSIALSKEIIFDKKIDLTNLSESWYDPDKLEKITNYVLFNAFKFTPSGGKVSLAISSDGSDLKMNVTDTGKGISKKEQEYIFSPFYQSKQVGDEGQPGTGLGLALVKELVNLHNGTINLISKENQGTTITITLPIIKERFNNNELAKPIISSTIALQPENQKIYPLIDDELDNSMEQELSANDSILIVEDNEDLRNYISSLLEDQFTTLTARDGEEAFSIATDQVPNLIISDVMMPKLNGISLTEKIKSDQRTNHIPIVLLTAKADEDSRVDGFKVGADDYLSKPFSAKELRARIANLIEQRKKLALKYKAEISNATIAPTTQEASLGEKFLLKAKQIVDNNIGNSGFGVEQMAEEIHLSRAQLFRKLKAIAGISPNEFINDIRLNKAAELIRIKADGLTQISYSVGYSEQSYFAKRFRKKFGVTPSEYQAKHAERE
jgi:signal transduction histidine kinase/AraC-like DNA-binding protein